MAWLHAVPEKAKGSTSEGDEKSRLQIIRDEKKSQIFSPDAPPITLPSHMLAYFWEVGPTMSGGMGPGPLTHGEIESWQRNIGIKLTAWECRTLKSLSHVYLKESQDATKRDCPAPWALEGQEVISLPALDTRNAIRELAKM